MSADITILCVTRAEPYALPFLEEMEELADDLDAPFILVADGDQAWRAIGDWHPFLMVRSHGYIESVLDEAVAACPDGYILRLDDDERASGGMYRWLLEREYRAADHWCFPRANLFPDETHRLAGACDGYLHCGSLYPDLQTRLSVKAKSGGRDTIHVGSPFGSGEQAPVVIEHHKFLVRSLNDRVALARRYETIQLGAGTGGYRAFSLPEVEEDLASVPYLEMVPA